MEPRIRQRRLLTARDGHALDDRASPSPVDRTLFAKLAPGQARRRRLRAGIAVDMRARSASRRGHPGTSLESLNPVLGPALLEQAVALEIGGLIVVDALESRVVHEADAVLTGTLGEVQVLAGHAKALIEEALVRSRSDRRSDRFLAVGVVILVQAGFDLGVDAGLLDLPLELIEVAPERSLAERRKLLDATDDPGVWMSPQGRDVCPDESCRNQQVVAHHDQVLTVGVSQSHVSSRRDRPRLTGRR